MKKLRLGIVFITLLFALSFQANAAPDASFAGEWSRIDTGSDGFAMMVTDTGSAVNLIDCDNEDCSVSTVTTVLAQSGDPFITHDANGLPRLVIYEYFSDTTTQIRCDDEACTTFSVDTVNTGYPAGQERGVENIAVLPDNTLAYMSHMSGAHGDDAVYVHCTTLDCSTTAIKTIYETPAFPARGGFFGYASDIEIDSNGLPQLVYAHQFPAALYLVPCDDADCSTFTTIPLSVHPVPSENGQERVYPDLELTSQDLPRISFGQTRGPSAGSYEGYPDARLILCDDVLCATKDDLIIDTDYSAGYYVRLELNSQDYPVMVYDYLLEDPYTIGLKSAECMNEDCTVIERNTIIDVTESVDPYQEGVLFHEISLSLNDDLMTTTAFGDDLGDYNTDYYVSPRSIEQYPKTEELMFQAEYNGIAGKYLGEIGYGMISTVGLDGLPRLAFYDYFYDTVRYIRCFNAECTLRKNNEVYHSTDQVSNSAPLGGGFLDIQVGSDGFARVLFTSGADGQQLRYAICDDDICSDPTVRLLESSADSYDYKSMNFTLDSNNVPHIIYHRRNTAPFFPALVDQYYGTCDDAVCTSFTSTQLEDEQNLQGTVGMAVSSTDDVLFTHYSTTDGLELWRCTNIDCTTRVETQLQPSSGAGYYSATDIVIGSDGLPRVLYLDNNTYLSEFLRCNDIDCTTYARQTLPFGPDSDYIEMSLDSNDLPRFGGLTFPDPDYYGSLEYVYCDDEECLQSNRVIIKDGNTAGDDLILVGGFELVDDTIPVFPMYSNKYDDANFDVIVADVVSCKEITCATINGPSEPTDHFANNTSAQLGRVNPADLASLDVLTSAVYQDQDAGDLATAYRLQVSKTTDFTDLVYDSSKTALTTNVLSGARSQDLAIPALNLDYATQYYWRVKFWDSSDTQGLYSSIQPVANTFTVVQPPLPTVNNFTPVSITQATTDVSFDVVRAGVGIINNDLKVTSGGVVVLEDGVCAAGYTCIFTPVVDGQNFTYKPTSGWTDGNYPVNIDYRLSSGGAFQDIADEVVVVSLPAVVTPPPSTSVSTPVSGGSGGGGGGAYRDTTVTVVGGKSDTTSPTPTDQDTDLVTVYPEDVRDNSQLSLAEKIYNRSITAIQEDPALLSMRSSAESLVGESLCIELQRDLAEYFATVNDGDFRTLIREHGLVLGRTAGDLDPSGNIARSEILRLVLQADCGSFTIPVVTEQPFPDVPTEHKDALYITLGKVQEIVSGYLHDGTYKPDNNISRAEALKVVLEVVLGRMGYEISGSGSTNLADVPRDAWYYRYVDYAVERGIILNEEFHPGDSASIDEVASFLLRTLEFAGR